MATAPIVASSREFADYETPDAQLPAAVPQANPFAGQEGVVGCAQHGRPVDEDVQAVAADLDPVPVPPIAGSERLDGQRLRTKVKVRIGLEHDHPAVEITGSRCVASRAVVLDPDPDPEGPPGLQELDLRLHREVGGRVDLERSDDEAAVLSGQQLPAQGSP